MDVILGFKSILDKLVGEKCWSYMANVNTGSCVSIGIGRKVLREKPLRNPRISKEERLYKGEFDLYVSCSWRLDWKGEVLCGSEDDKSEQGPIMTGLREMLNRRVVSVELEEPGLDLALIFEDDLVLRVFCDEFEQGEEALENYVLFLPDRQLVVGARSNLVEYESSNPGRILDFQLVGAPSRGELNASEGLKSLGIWKHPGPEDQEICSLIGSHCTGFEIPEEGHPSIQFSFVENGALQIVNLTIGCSWRLDSPLEILCGIGMSQDEKRQNLDQITGQAIRTIEMSSEMDLRILFENGLKLSIFCNNVNQVSMWDNYLIEGPWGAFIVGTCGGIRRGTFSDNL